MRLWTSIDSILIGTTFAFNLSSVYGSGLTEEEGTSRMSLFAQGFKECLVCHLYVLSCQFDGFLAGNLLCRCAALHRIPGLLFVKAVARGSWQLRGGLNKKQWSRKGLLISYIQWNLIEFVPWSELLDKVQSWWSKESTSDLPVSEGCQQRFLQLMVVAPSPLAMLVGGPTDTLCKSRSTQSRFVN